jgi:hypothetical protein
MPRKIKDVTRDYLVNVPLPTHANTYTVISHDSIINYAFAELAANGFGVVSEEYRSTLDGQIAQGIYKLQYNSDVEMSLMFAWSNSYNKQMRFKCAVGGYLHANQTVMISADMGSYSRKHTGTADADTIASIQSQIVSAKMYYDQLVLDKEMMKGIDLPLRKQAELLGILFAEYEILTTEQASIIRQQMDKPSFYYNGGKNTLWAFYNHVTVALQNSHPRTWMEDQRMLHWFISNEFDLSTPVVQAAVVTPSLSLPTQIDPLAVIPNQTNILDQIAEIEAQEEIVIHIETDQEYLERVAEIELNNPIITEDFTVMSTDGTEFKFDMNPDGTVKSLSFTDEPIDEVVHYTDPAGNTFEAPVVESKAPQEFIDALVNAPEMEASEVDMSKVTWVDAPETVKEVEVAPERVKFAIDNTEVASLEPTPEEHALLEAEDKVVDDFGFDFDLSSSSDDEEDNDADHDFFL